jgi:hypothetical protein
MDVTFFNGAPHLSVINNCSRFAIVRRLKSEAASSVVGTLEDVFCLVGPPRIVISDNGSNFRSREVAEFLKAWGVELHNTCAYRSEGNGLIERLHRTVKRMGARSGRSLSQMTFWYNNTTNCSTGQVPYEALFNSSSRLPGLRDDRRPTTGNYSAPQKSLISEYGDSSRNPYRVGDKVYVKASPSCTKPWEGPRTVTGVPTSLSVELDESTVPRHVSHVRRFPGESESNTSISHSDFAPAGAIEVDITVPDHREDEAPTVNEDWTHDDTIPAVEEVVIQSSSRPVRNRRPPAYLADYNH